MVGTTQLTKLNDMNGMEFNLVTKNSQLSHNITNKNRAGTKKGNNQSSELKPPQKLHHRQVPQRTTERNTMDGVPESSEGPRASALAKQTQRFARSRNFETRHVRQNQLALHLKSRAAPVKKLQERNGKWDYALKIVCAVPRREKSRNPMSRHTALFIQMSVTT